MDISCCLMLHGRGTSYLFFSFLKLKHKHTMQLHRPRKNIFRPNSPGPLMECFEIGYLPIYLPNIILGISYLYKMKAQMESLSILSFFEFPRLLPINILENYAIIF